MKKNFAMLLMAILAALLCTGCPRVLGQKQETDKKEDVEVLVPVRTEVLEESTLYDIYTTNGDVGVRSSIQVYPSVAGRIVSSEIKLGQNVNKGDVIAVIDPSLTGGRYVLNNVVSPVSGTVLTEPLAAGSTASSDTLITTIGNLDDIQISIRVPERFYSKVKVGQSAKLDFEAYKGESFSAIVSSISPVLDSASRTCEVILTPEDSNGRITSGMYAHVSLILEEFENVISVLDTIIREDGNERFVFVLSADGSIEKRAVDVKRSVGRRSIISSGLASGERVVVEGYESLSDGERVQDVSKGVTR